MEFFMTHHPNNLPILLIEMCIINAKKGIMMMNLILKGTMDGDGWKLVIDEWFFSMKKKTK